MIKVKSTPEKSKAISQKINRIFEEADINPNPMNYLVWYHYFIGENQELVKEINALPEGAKSFNDSLGLRFYEQYLETPEPKEAIDYEFAMKKFVDTVLYKMNDLNIDISSQTKQINDFAQELKDSPATKKDIEKLTDSIISAAENMENHTMQMSHEVHNSSEEVKQLRKELNEARRDAMTDELTQLGNRKAFNNLIQDLSIHHQHNPEPFCLILTDIDHFKSVNDTYGHTIGDSILRYYAKVMKKDAQPNERICRYGGEEFAIILKNTSLDEATARAEQIRQELEAVRLTLKGSSEPIKPITASFGISFFHGEHDDLDSFINRADQSLYAAKHAGRNNVMHEMLI